MSAKRQSSLLNFFAKTPKTDESQTTGVRKVMIPKQDTARMAKTSLESSQSSTDLSGPADESPIKQKRPLKRRCVIASDSESESELNTQSNGNEEVENHCSMAVDKEKEINNSTAKTQKRKKLEPNGTPRSSRKFSSNSEFVGEIAQSFISSFRATEEDLDASTLSSSPVDKNSLEDLNKNNSEATVLIDECAAGRFPHLDFEFLQPDKIRDADRRSANHPDYCPRTLYVPEGFLKTQTPGHRQWWLAKSQYFDTILFFKVGKFYEMYHMDAVIGVENLNLTYMRGKIAHCGFPEVAYGRFADQLVSRGYKVARVEQTETPNQLEERNRKEKARDKVVKREVCRVTTPGTRTYGVLDGSDERSALESVESTARYLLAFAEEALEAGISSYGVCFVDTSVGTFYLGQFSDDRNRSCMRTLLAHYQPSQILYERGRITTASVALLQNVVGAVPKDALVPKKEFLTPEASLELLSNKLYFGGSKSEWPEVVRQMLVCDSVVAKCSPLYRQCISALGTVVRYLKCCLIDVDMVSMRKFECYNPAFSSEAKTENVDKTGEEFWTNKRLILDGVTLYNLNIVPPLTGVRKGCLQDSISSKFSLYNTINKCSTAFGKRLLRQWVCAPTCDVKLLLLRQKAIAWLLNSSAQKFVSKATEVLRKIPDLERLAQKIHTLGLKYRAEQHPDGRAVMFEALRYNRRKINDLLMALDGFERVVELQKLYEKYRPEAEAAELLERCFVSQFPDVTPDLKHFRESFDHEKAKCDGVIVPEKGLDADYDAALDNITECLQNLEAYLVKTRKKLRCQNIQFHYSGRDRYHLEIPENVAKNLDSDYEMSSTRKGYKRMITDDLKQLIEELSVAEQRRDEIRGDVMRRVFADFDCRTAKWAAVTERAAMFDVLLSLARYARSCGLEMCQPEFVCNASQPFLEIKAGSHPCLAAKLCAVKDSSSDFTYVPNDTSLGGELPSTMLLTGPNMGGKSTLMRQVAVLVILAQIGSLVPAKKMCLSPVDRIFTRIGANDRIAAGQSTFFVELSEANVILRDATKHSLVLIDELGRGTSTHDGTAIAYAVLKNMAEKLQCRTFFSTHYHTLCKAVNKVKNIMTAHMACVVDNANEDDPTLESVTFLYKLTEGICPKSYGFFAAKVSGIKAEVVRTAFAASKQIDAGTSLSAKLAAIRAVTGTRSVNELSQMVAAL